MPGPCTVCCKYYWRINEVEAFSCLNFTLCLGLQFSSVAQLCLTFCDPMDCQACQASLSITNSWSLLKLISIKSVMPSNHLILCRPLLLLPSVFPSIRVFSSESVPMICGLILEFPALPSLDPYIILIEHHHLCLNPSWVFHQKDWWEQDKPKRSCQGPAVRNWSWELKEIEEPKISPHLQPERAEQRWYCQKKWVHRKSYSCRLLVRWGLEFQWLFPPWKPWLVS